MHTKTQASLLLKQAITLLIGSLLLSACTPVAAATNISVNTELPVTDVPETVAAPIDQSPPNNTETAVTFGRLSLSVPPAVANGASGNEYPRIDSDDAAWWQKTPGHLTIMLGDYYVLQRKFQQPQIYVYPAQAYAEFVPAAFESIHRLNNILGDPGASLSADQLPAIPFFNARQVFASNVQMISFQNGSGVRFLTEYAQYNAPVNNHELFYHFQGVTRDGTYYVLAVLPVTAPGLADTNETVATIPNGGIAYPDITDPNADWQGYYTDVTDLLNGASPDSFTPTLNQLDMMIESILIAP